MTTQDSWETRYAEDLRRLLQAEARPMDLRERYKEYPPDDDINVSTYGWTDFNAWGHLVQGGGKCPLVIPPGALVTERTYSMFTDTFSDNENEVGLNVHPVTCGCGLIVDGWARWTGSLGEAVRKLTGTEDVGRVIQL